MSYLVNRDIPQGCVTCLHGRFTDSGFMYCELKMKTPTEGEKIRRPDWCPLEERKSGKWIYKRLDKFRKYQFECPFCHAVYVDNFDGYVDVDNFNYCPNCGAKMEGDQKV